MGRLWERIRESLRKLNDWLLTRGGVPMLNVLGVQAFVHSYAYTQLFRYVEQARDYLETRLNEMIKRRVDEEIKQRAGQVFAELEMRMQKMAEALEKDLGKRIGEAKRRSSRRAKKGGEHAS